MPPSPPTLRLPEKQTIFTESEDSSVNANRKTRHRSSYDRWRVFRFVRTFILNAEKTQLRLSRFFSHPSGQGKAVLCPKGIGLRIILIDPQEDPFQTRFFQVQAQLLGRLLAAIPIVLIVLQAEIQKCICVGIIHRSDAILCRRSASSPASPVWQGRTALPVPLSILSSEYLNGEPTIHKSVS